MPRKLVPERRDQILASARRLFAQHGYQGTNIADIAADLRLGHGTFYRYFRNKRDIFDKVLEDVIARIAALASGEEPARSLVEYRAKIDRVCRGLLQLFREDPAAARLLFYESIGVDREMEAKIHDALEIFASFTEQDLKHGKKLGYLPKDLDEATTARAMNALTFEAIRHCLKAKSPDREAERWLAAALRLVFRGIG